MTKSLPPILYLFLILLLVNGGLYAQNGERDALEFGKIDPELFEIDLYQEFPDADAVILNDLGRVSILMLDNSPKVLYTYLRRIKILSESGKRFAKGSIEIDESEGEAILDFKAVSHKLNADGDPVSFPINRRKIKEERIKGVKRIYSFEFPFVEVGSIVEYTYQVRGKEIDKLRSWKFHRDIPVVQSEFQTFIPATLEYLPIITGNRALIHEFRNSYQERIDPNRFSPSRYNRSSSFVNSPGMYGSRSLFGNFNAFIMVNVPSLEKEAFSLNSESEGSQVSLQLKKEGSRGRGSTIVFENWNGLNKQMLKRLRSKKVKAKKKRIAEASNRIKKEVRGKRALMKETFLLVQKQIKWNKEYGLSSINVDRAVEKKAGSAGDINMYLYHLLKNEGLETYPVLISTRDFGRVNPTYATLSQFNHVIVLTVIDGEEILLDASSDLERIGMLPPNDLNQFGYVINSEGGRWITLKSHNKVNRVTYSRFNLNTEGSLKGEISVENRDYSVILEQKKLEEYAGKNDEYLLEEILIGLNDPTIFDKSMNVPNNEKDPLIISCELSTADFVQVADEGQVIIFKPMMIKAVLENPFENKIRNTPVDFPYPLTDSHMIGVRLPEGFELVQIPTPIRVVLPNDGGSFTFNVLQMGNIIHFTSAIHINQTTYPPEEYNGIRSFFEYVVNKHKEDMIIRKIQ